MATTRGRLPFARGKGAAPSRRTRRAQAATEYIIMFAVVVIIALIVAGVLGGFPTISSGVSERESATYWMTATIAIPKHHVSLTSSQSSITFRNNHYYPVFLDWAEFNDAELVIGRTVSPGSSISVDGGNTVWCPLQGAKYYFNVTLHYVDLETGSNLTFFGDRPLVGICQPG